MDLASKKQEISASLATKLRELLGSGHHEAMTMSLFCIKEEIDYFANRERIFITDLEINFYNNSEVIVHELSELLPEKWKTKGLDTFLASAWQGLGSCGLLLYGIKIKAGEPISFKLGEHPEYRFTCYDLKAFPKAVSAEAIDQKAEKQVVQADSYL